MFFLLNYFQVVLTVINNGLSAEMVWLPGQDVVLLRTELLKGRILTGTAVMKSRPLGALRQESVRRHKYFREQFRRHKHFREQAQLE